MAEPGFHHVAYACRDVDATHHFYEDLMGFPLVHTEIKNFDDGFFRHLFFALPDGSALAFFDIHEIGETPEWDAAISTGNGLPVWVNHVAFSATEERQEEVRAKMSAEDIKPAMEMDHGWCHSLYYMDPNGIMVELCRNTGGFEVDTAEAAKRLHSREETDRTRIIVPAPR